MKRLMTGLAVVAACCSTTAFAAESCETQADARKLAGAARTSFVKKCEKDAKGATAKTSCDAQAAEKKLAGAAKNSFVKKCVADAGA